jgi:2,4-didehydro-3-deoxy-L-rhamnonate hydrolase
MIRLGLAATGSVVVEHEGACYPAAELLGDGARAPEMIDLITRWNELGPALERGAQRRSGGSPAGECQMLAPLMPRKLICTGANYQAHNAEMLGEVKDPFPFCFLKPPSTTVVGDGAVVALPAYAQQVDYEGELALVMRGPNDVFGYTVLNDLSVRDWVPATSPLGIDWLVSKCFDGSAPLGPWITPVQYVADPDDLGLRLWVNDELRQDSNTANMVFGTKPIVEHVSRTLTIEPGDVIATGTPEGVGAGRKPPAWLAPGDEIRVELEGLGTLRTVIGEPRDPSAASSS